jgi:putative addiction module killer protein
MVEIRQTEEFFNWISSFRDTNVKGRILTRIDRIQLGLIGDAKHVGHGVSELRLDFGPGYRIYFARHGREIILLLHGGDKGSQNRDISKAHQLLKNIIGGKHEKGKN